jgi:hypothetical protein
MPRSVMVGYQWFQNSMLPPPAYLQYTLQTISHLCITIILLIFLITKYIRKILMTKLSGRVVRTPASSSGLSRLKSRLKSRLS